MLNAVARTSSDTDVSQFRVAGIGEATELLKRERFVFVGAPNRWRREAGDRVTRADIRHSRDGGCVVVLYQWQRPVAC